MLKDALRARSTSLNSLQQSPKICPELATIVEELQGCLEPVNGPSFGGARPLRACGTRFVAHKVSALSRLVEYFGGYLSHVAALTEDATVKSIDKQRLKGYLKWWQQGKFLIAGP